MKNTFVLLGLMAVSCVLALAWASTSTALGRETQAQMYPACVTSDALKGSSNACNVVGENQMLAGKAASAACPANTVHIRSPIQLADCH